MKLRKIISGGQVGADQGGLAAAYWLKLETGGWAPKNFMTLHGPNPDLLKSYGLVEMQTESYKERTFANVRDADATVRFARSFNTPGERCTLRAILHYKKPYLDLNIGLWEGNFKSKRGLPLMLRDFLERNNVEVLNIAGNAAHSPMGAYRIEKCVYEIITEALR